MVSIALSRNLFEPVRRVLLALPVILLSSCANQPMVKPSMALIQIDMDGKHMTRVQNPRITSVNGSPHLEGGDHAYLKPGWQELEIRFAMVGAGEQSAKLRFHAGPESYYSVRFETFPHAPGRLMSDYNAMGDGADLFALPIWLAGNYIAHQHYLAKERKMQVVWTHVTVISANPIEGEVASATVQGKLRADAE